MVDDVEEAADRYFAAHHPELEKTLLLASRTGPRDAESLIANVRRDMTDQISAYREGWTAPRHKPRIERHPILYAAALLMLGAVVSGGITAFVESAGR